MKISKEQLKQVIKEELDQVMKESEWMTDEEFKESEAMNRVAKDLWSSGALNHAQLEGETWFDTMVRVLKGIYPQHPDATIEKLADYAIDLD